MVWVGLYGLKISKPITQSISCGLENFQPYLTHTPNLAHILWVGLGQNLWICGLACPDRHPYEHPQQRKSKQIIQVKKKYPQKENMKWVDERLGVRYDQFEEHYEWVHEHEQRAWLKGKCGLRSMLIDGYFSIFVK